MKKYLLLMIVAFLTNTVFAQEKLSYEVRTAPAALLARWITLDFSLNLVSEHWSLGPSVIIYAAPKIGNMFTPSYNGTALGGHLYYYFKSFSESSWYSGNHLYYEEYESYPHNFTGHYQYQGFKFNPKAGYQIATSSGINIMLGAGLELRSYHQKNIDDSNGVDSPSFKNYSAVIPYVEAKLGFKF
jgi:hypothetical protein